MAKQVAVKKGRNQIYNSFYTQKDWELVNPLNKDLLEDYLQKCKQRGRADSTIYQYRNDLRILMLYILKKKRNRYVLELNRKDFRNYSLFLTTECGMSNARVNRLRSACNNMLDYCEQDDDYDYDINFSKKVKGLPKKPVRTNEDNFFFTYDEFIKVREELINRGKLQYAVMWSIAYDSGARKNEVFQITKHGLLENNYTNEVIGKRGKKFKLPYLNDTKELIRQYLEERGEDDIDSLWISEIKGEKKPLVDCNALYTRILYISDILSEIRGERCDIFFHSIRHSRAECLTQGEDLRLLDSNGNPRKYSLNEVQVFLHHSSSETTQGYLKNHDTDIIDDMMGF